MNKRITRKLCIVGLISSIVLSGCGNAGITGGNREELSGGTDKVVSLKVWTEKDGLDVMNKMLDSFKEQYKDEAEFDITVEIQADSQVRDVMLTDVHNGADVFSFPDDQIISLTAGGVLTEVPNADEIAAANNKKVAMEFDSGWYLYTFFGNTGLSLSIKPDGITNECNWNSQTGDITGAAIKQALNSIAANPGFVSMPNGDIAEHIKSGDVIAGISGVWDVMNVKGAWGENYGACKLPTYTVAGKEVQMSSFTGYKMMGVNSYSKNKEWACRLADWLTNQQNQELRFKEKNQGPSNSKAAESEEIKKVAAIQAIIAQSQYGTLQRVGNSYWDACKKFANTVLSGNNGGLSDQEVMDTLVNEITASAVK